MEETKKQGPEIDPQALTQLLDAIKRDLQKKKGNRLQPVPGRTIFKMVRFQNVRGNHITNRKKRRIRKEIREAVRLCLATVIGAVVIAALLFGASFQEQDKLAVMAAAEVTR